jgi:hypothetical protein
MSSDASHLHLMNSRADALFTQDDRGRMIAVNEPSGGPAPSFYLGRTAEGSFARFGHTLSGDQVQHLQDTAQSEPVGDLSLLPKQHGAFVALFPGAEVWGGPAYAFPDVELGTDTAISINTANAGLLHGAMGAWQDAVDFRCPLVAVVEEGRAVAVCASVRITPEVHEAGVETLPEYRSKGYAARAVAGWADLVRNSGATPVYSTSWDNTASRSVAAKLELVQFGEDFHLT